MEVLKIKLKMEAYWSKTSMLINCSICILQVFFFLIYLQDAVIISDFVELNVWIINQCWIINDFEESSCALTKPPLWHLPVGTAEDQKKPQDSWYSKWDSSQTSSNASLSVTVTPHGSVTYFLFEVWNILIVITEAVFCIILNDISRSIMSCHYVAL